MKVIFVTSEWPTENSPSSGSFVALQVEKLKALGAEVEVFSFRGSMSPTRYYRAWINLRKILRSKKFDIMHAHFGQSGLLALPKIMPLVVTYHGSDLNGYVPVRGKENYVAGKILRYLSLFVSKFANEIIVVSPKLKNKLGRNEAHVIPCGIDAELFSPMSIEEARNKLGLSTETKLVLFAGNPSNPVKQYHLAKAATELVKNKSELPIELISVTDEPHHRMPLYMNACDVLLLTSISEGSPMVIKEALACNLPIVSVDVGDVRERISDVGGCFIAPDEDPNVLAMLLSQAINQTHRTDGRKFVMHLDETRLAEKILDVYRSAIGTTRNTT